jgi:hypothetical protein
MKRFLLATLALLALATPASAATKTYDVERIWIRIIGEFNGNGWVFLEDVLGVRSTVQVVLISDEGEIRYRCHAFGPHEGPPRDFNLANVGPFAQQGTGATNNAFAFFLRFGCGTQVTGVTVSCPFAGVRAPEAIDHETVDQSGTYRTTNDLISSYKITGHRDRPDFCEITITSPELGSETFEGLAILARLKQAHTGDTSFRDFWRDPITWLDLRDVTFPF